MSKWDLDCLRYYQPQFSSDDNSLVGAEALVRWHHPKLGEIPPLEFIPLSEEMGTIAEIGNWILKNACEQIQKWNLQGYANFPIAVNISTRQFYYSDIFECIKNIMNELKFPAENLKL